jgi:hypothetical protein
VEVLDRIHRTLKEERGEDALTPQQLKQAAKERVFGFEILPAPYVIAHLQLGMYLQRAHAPLTEEHEGKRERAGVYLTNALTGWEPPDKQKARLPFQEFEEEREEADTVKRDKPILVVLGNPPYNAFAGVSPTEEDGLVEPYKEGLIKDWGIKKFNLDDLYIRFFRLAERRIAEKSHRGVVCFISNFSYLSEPSYVVMRKRLLNGFDALWFDCLNGDSRETGKLTPEGKPDPSVFSTDSNREGIRVGTAIALMVRRDKANQPPESPGPVVKSGTCFVKGHDFSRAETAPKSTRALAPERCSSDHAPTVLYREFWGTRKREELVESLQDAALEGRYTNASPTHANRFSFQPQEVSAAYSEWPKITELCVEQPSNGLMEKRGGALIDCDREKLEERMRLYHDKSLDWDAYRLASSTLTGDWARFDARKARARALDAGFHSEQIVRYAVRPFDTRWCYYSDARPIWNEPRPALWAQCFEGNSFLLTRMRCTASPEGFPISFSRCLSDDHYIIPDAVAVPFLLRHPATSMFASEQTDGNLSSLSSGYLQSVGLGNSPESAALLWLHILAIGYSPAYLEENADGIRQNWPRIPLPLSLEQFQASAALGERVAELLDTEKPVAGVTAGALRSELRSVAGLKRMDGKPLNVEEDLQLTAGWGHAGKEGVTMPGRGKLVSRERTAKELSELTKGLTALGIPQEEGLARLGGTVVDVYLNDLCAWTNVPEKVWELYIGGYQVMKKWLSYREFSFLNRPLTLAEAEEVQAMARRLTALCLLQPELDANYCKGKSVTWPGRPAS